MNFKNLFNFNVKPKILFYADSVTTERLAEQYKKYLTEYEIDIALDDWQNTLYAGDYDILCHTNLALLMWKTKNFEEFIKEQHRHGTKVVLFDRNQIFTSLELYQHFDGIFLNDISHHLKLKEFGLPSTFMPDGVDLNVFGPDVPFTSRSFKIVSRKSDFVWQELKEKFPKIDFVEVFDKQISTEKLNEIYNTCQVFYGTIGCLEAAACGVIPVMKRKNEFEKIKNIFMFDDDQSIIEKIIDLKNNKDTTLISQRASKEMLSWDYRFLSQHWAESIQQIMLKKKAVCFA